jgi:hypothetical protein
VSTSNYGRPVVTSTPYVAATTYGHAGTTTSIPINPMTTTTSYSTAPVTGGVHFVQAAPITYTTTEGFIDFTQSEQYLKQQQPFKK